MGLSEEYHQVLTAVLLRPGSSLAISYQRLPKRAWACEGGGEKGGKEEGEEECIGDVAGAGS
jgi:hypothetical protein